MAYDCPGCGVPYDRPSSTASHAYQIGDSQHPWESYEEALRAVNSHQKEQHNEDVGGDPPTPTPTGSGDPSMAAPPRRGEPEHVCPECGETTDRMSGGRVLTVQTPDGQRHGTTDEGDRLCRECSTVISTDGETYEVEL